MSRSTSEWIAKHDDEAIPPRVKLRIFQKFNKRCAACTLPIIGKLRPEYDHIRALVNGGTHRESNLQLLCSACHRVKSKADVAEKSDMRRKQLKAAGIRKPSRMRGQGFRKPPGQHSATRPIERKTRRTLSSWEAASHTPLRARQAADTEGAK